MGDSSCTSSCVKSELDLEKNLSAALEKDTILDKIAHRYKYRDYQYDRGKFRLGQEGENQKQQIEK